MATYDSLRSLPLHIDGYYLEPLEREVARGFTLRRTVVVLHGRGEEGRGEEVDYDPAQQTRFQEQGGETAARRRAHARSRSRLLQSGQTEYRRWALESAALDLALAAVRAVARRRDRASGAAASLRRLDARRERAALARALSRASLQARPGHRLDGRDRDIARCDRPGRDRGLQGDLPRRVRRAAGSLALRPHRRRLPRRLDRGSRAHARNLGDPRRAPRPHHVGRGIHEWTDVEALAVHTARAQLQAVAVRLGQAALRFLRRAARSEGSRSTAAASTSSARGATRSSCSPRSSIPTRRTTSRRTAST